MINGFLMFFGHFFSIYKEHFLNFLAVVAKGWSDRWDFGRFLETGVVGFFQESVEARTLDPDFGEFNETKIEKYVIGGKHEKHQLCLL